MHDKERKISSVKSTISKFGKDVDECYDNAEKPDADMATLLSKGNAFRESIKKKKRKFKWFRGGSWKSKEREKKVNMQVLKDRWTRLYY